MSTLADRIRGIVKSPAPSVSLPPLCDPPAPPALPASPADAGALPVLERALDGEWRDGCFVVEHRRPAASRHGKDAVGQVAARLDQTAADAALLTHGKPAQPPFLFLDLETTGLSGGAGTLAFLVGCGWFDGDGSFVTRQFLLTRFQDERALLERVAAELAAAGALVSFNGKSFDAPLLETRFLFHRLDWIGGRLPHVDVLHPARRFWKTPTGSPKGLRYETPVGNPEGLRYEQDGSPGDLRYLYDDEEHAVAQPFRAAAGGCSLQTLERQIVGARRSGDIPGFQIPARYFQFVRSGDAAPLRTILEHNRLDLLTLAALTARLLHLTRTGPDGARDAREALALGHVYASAGLDDRARGAYRRAIDRCRSPRGAYDLLRIDALRRLAYACRRGRLFDDAAECWLELLEMRGCPPLIEREATAALAIHNEHRRRDLGAAKEYALRTLEAGEAPAWKAAAQHRIARLNRKLTRAQESRSLQFEA